MIVSPRGVAAVTSIALAGLLGMSASADAATITFDLRSGNGTGNNSQRTFTSGGVTVYASAWYTANGNPNSDFAAAALQQWGTGLGVCNGPEGGANCGSPQHQVDNHTERDYVLFLFSEGVNINSALVDPHGSYDTDVSYWLGNVATVPGLSLAGFDLTGLNAIQTLGFGNEQTSDGPTTSGTYLHTLNTATSYNALLFGTRRDNTNGVDRFKLPYLTVTTVPPPPPPPSVPEPMTLALLGLGLAAGARRLRRS